MFNFEKSGKPASDSSVENTEKMPSFTEHMTEMQRQGEEDPEKVENFKKLATFFNRDASIKKNLVKLAPDAQAGFGGGGAEYSDKLYEGFRGIKFDLHRIMQDYYPSEKIEERLRQIEMDIINSGADSTKLSRVYQNDFALMSEDFNKGVRERTIGYYTSRTPHAMDEKARSVNEMLHLMHSSIVNNEQILKRLPVLEKDDRGEVTLYGTHDSMNDVASGVFEGMKDGGFTTDIVAIDNQTIMMVRDRGHALTVDIQQDSNGKHYVEYFIPKICNVDKVNKLPGVRKVQKRDGENQVREFTTGVFVVDKEADVASEVLKFISMVPTDDDIEFNF